MHITRGQLLQLIMDAGVDAERVNNLKADIPLVDQEIDSIDFPAILLTISDTLNITFDDEDSFKLKTMEDIENFINAR